MKCPQCGDESPEGTAFCGSCGYDFSSDSIMSALDDGSENESAKSAGNPKPKKTRRKAEKASVSEEDAKRRAFKIKLILIVIAVFAVIVIIGILVLSRTSTAGEKVFKNIPIGRDIAYAESKTGTNFTIVSKFDAMDAVAVYDGICEAEKSVKIEGTHFPEWAVTVSLAADNTINKTSYYNFAQLQKSWKGHYSSAEIPITDIEYGMNEKTVRRKLGFEPFTVIKSIDNSASYVYRYYYTDGVTGNDRVFNFVVVFNDADGSVKDVYIQEIKYCGLLLSFK